MNEKATKLSAEHQWLASLEGHWHGITETHLQPPIPIESAETKASFVSLLSGLFLQEESDGRVLGKPHKGYRIYGYDPQRKKFTCLWFDSFHTGASAISLEGKAEGQKVTLQGSYFHETEKFGWKTILEIVTEGELQISQFNIFPDGRELLAIKTVLKRR
jgi:hypothetical protein